VEEVGQNPKASDMRALLESSESVQMHFL